MEPKKSKPKSRSTKSRAPKKRKPKAPKIKLSLKKVIILTSCICFLCISMIVLSAIMNSGENIIDRETLSKNEEIQNESIIHEKTEVTIQNDFSKEREALQNENLALQEKYDKLRAENERKMLEAQKLAAQKLESQKLEAQRKEEALRFEEEKRKSENLALQSENEKLRAEYERQKQAAERLEAQNELQKLEAQKLESQRLEAQKIAAQKQEALRQETLRLEAEKRKSEELSKKVEAAKKTETSTAKKAKTQVASVAPSYNEKIQEQIPKNRFNIPPASNGATIVLIIDDAGRSAENTKRYTSLPFPLTIAVLPKLPQTKQCAQVIRSSGKELILHQPMQSQNLRLDPGPGAIRSDMSSIEIIQTLKENLGELGSGVKGLNNHEGSLITADELRIGTVLDVCKELGIYFLDSRTTAQTQAPVAAKQRDMRIYEKAGPYIDNDIDRAKMLERMYETLNYANRHGRAIVIAHVDKSVNILPELLNEMYPYMKAAGYKFATPSMIK